MTKPGSDKTKITHDITPWFTADPFGIDYLAARLDVSGVKRPVLHRFSALTPVRSRQLSGHLLAFGFDIIDNPSVTNTGMDEVTLTICQQSTTNPDDVAATRRTLERAVDGFGGRYESWLTCIATRREVRREKLEAMRDHVSAPGRRSSKVGLADRR